MGVGLDTGLLIDAIAEELHEYLDDADDASLSGDTTQLVPALVELSKRLLAIRPFVPDDPLPENWEEILKAWVTGATVNQIGPDNMKVVEDAFTYRMVWALEALRTRRTVFGWESDTIAGGAAAALETGVPQFMMSMLIRAGLPSRQAAMIAVAEGEGIFIDGAGLREWLESDLVTALTETGEWPSSETAALWVRFRDDTLSEQRSRWRTRNAQRTLLLKAGQPHPSPGIYRVEVEAETNEAWICTPDFRRVAVLRAKTQLQQPTFLAARFVAGDLRPHIRELGPQLSKWYVETQ